MNVDQLALADRIIEQRESLALQAEGDRSAVSQLLFALLLARFCDERSVPLCPEERPHDARRCGDRRNPAFATTLFAAPAGICQGLFDTARSAIGSIEMRLSVEMLARLYEPLFNLGNNKRDGLFYTPQPIVTRILDAALEQAPERPLLFDPTCGSGLFLLEALQLLGRGKRAEEKMEILSGCIFGADKDARAVETARLLLLLALVAEHPEALRRPLPRLNANLRAANSLFDAEDLGRERQALDSAPLSWKEAFPAAARRGGFDCVIGNPPYGLKRGSQLSELENQLLKKRYADFRSGKVNKYLAFMARGYELLAPGARLCMVVPNAWLGINGGMALRKHLLQEGALARLIVFDQQIFPAARVEAVIFCADKGHAHRRIEVTRLTHGESALPISSFSISAERCLSTPDARIPALWCEDAEAVFEQLEGRCSPLSAEARFLPLIALQAYAVGKGRPPQTAEQVKAHVFHCKTKADEEAYPYLAGSDIGRYSLCWSGSYLRFGPWLAEPQTIDRFCGPRLALREILGPLPHLLIGTYLDSPFLYNKSVLHIVPRAGAGGPDILALLAILNSTLASFVIAYRGRKSQRRLFPKIVNEDLRDFPLPPSFRSCTARLAALAEQRLGAKTAAEIEAAERCIEEAVFESYGLDEYARARLSSALRRCALTQHEKKLESAASVLTL